MQDEKKREDQFLFSNCFNLEDGSFLQIEVFADVFYLQPIGKKGKKYFSHSVTYRELASLIFYLEQAGHYAQEKFHTHQKNGLTYKPHKPFSDWKISVNNSISHRTSMAFHGPYGGAGYNNALRFENPLEALALADFLWQELEAAIKQK